MTYPFGSVSRSDTCGSRSKAPLGALSFPYDEVQYGLSLGGPILRDRLHSEVIEGILSYKGLEWK